MTQTIELVRFRLSGYPLVVLAEQVGIMQPLDDPARHNRERLRRQLGLPESTSPLRQQALQLKCAGVSLDCAVDAPVELLNAPAEAILPLPPLMQDCQRLPAVRALLHYEGELHLLLDLRRLSLSDTPMMRD